MFVVAAAPAEGKSQSESLAPTSSASHSLLVVEPHGRHVGEEDRLEAPDVDPDFHGCCNAESIDLVNMPDSLLIGEVNDDSAKVSLPFELVVRLCCQFLAMQSNRLALLRYGIRKVIIIP